MLKAWRGDVIIARCFLVGLVGVALWTNIAEVAADEFRFIPCASKSIFGIRCPGCGMTRSCVSLVQGKFADALHYHPFSWLIVGLAIAYSFFPNASATQWSKIPKYGQYGIIALLLVLVFGLWIVRLVGDFS